MRRVAAYPQGLLKIGVRLSTNKEERQSGTSGRNPDKGKSQRSVQTVIRRINLRRLSQIKTNEKTEKMEHTSNKTPPKSHIIQGHEKNRQIKLKAQM